MAPIAMAAIAAYGAYTARKDAKDSKKRAEKGVDSSSTTTRTPYAPAQPHIDAILGEAGRLYGQGTQGSMPYAWQDFMNNPSSPGAGANPTYGGSPAGGGGAAAGPALTWKGKDQAAVRQSKTDRQNARTAGRNAQNAPGGAGGSGAPAGTGGASGSPGAASTPQFQPQGGPFGYSQGLRDYMMQQMQGPGVGGYQPALNYIQTLLGGQSVNPMLTQAMDRVQAPKPDYFSAFRGG